MLSRANLAAAIVAAALLGGDPLLAAAESGNKLDFNRDVRPILAGNCFHCHGPDADHNAAGLRLDAEDEAKADRGGYRAIDADAPDKSEVLLRVTSADPDLVMPPPDAHKELTSEQIETLKAWVADGAPWSLPWAYVPPKRTDAPEVAAEDWAANWVDRFVLRRLEAEGLAPSADADPVTLVRRLSFDLTGLPPDEATVAAFAADPSEAAYERLVDRLLASPEFGERMATYWLDLVRFADTVGYHGDQNHGIWPYRDYVIHAFNTNKPFDRFTHEQIAGDQLPDAGEDELIASAYNRLLQTSHEGGVQLKEYRAIYMADRVRNVSQVWMAATMGCCQCHDHKFDPLSTEEFYSLGAFFADIDDEKHLRNPYGGLNTSPTKREPQKDVLSIYQRQRLEQIETELTGLSEDAAGGLVAQLKAERDAIKPTSTMISKSSAPREVRLLPRGNWQDESGPVVQPKAPAALGEIATGGQRASRLDLARWLTNRDGVGGLTARVQANRFWYLMFGRGIAGVLDDFGGQGEPPTNPELLDALAVEFLDSGWDVKHMMRLLAMSRAYRQSSVASPELAASDPDNLLLARQARFRLPAEMIRDTALAVSGLLVSEVGGPSVKPYQPVGYLKHLNYPRRKYVAHKDERQWRRGVYVHWQRQYLHPMLKAFDAPSREECTAQRPRSNTPLSALTLLNDPTFVEAARNFAASAIDAASQDADRRIDWMYRRAVSREPDEFEREQITSLVAEQLAHYQSNPADADALLGVGYSDRTEADAVELAAWTYAARVVLNLNETLTRN